MRDRDTARQQLRVALGPLELPPFRIERLNHADLVWLAANMYTNGNREERGAAFRQAVSCLRVLLPGCFVVGDSLVAS